MRIFTSMIIVSFLAILILPIAASHTQPLAIDQTQTPTDDLVKKENKTWQDVTVFALIVICANVPLWIREFIKAKETAKVKNQAALLMENSEEVKAKVSALDQKFKGMITVCEIKHGAVNDIIADHASQLKNHDSKIFDMATKKDGK